MNSHAGELPRPVDGDTTPGHYTVATHDKWHTRDLFMWASFDVRPLLPAHWQLDLLRVADAHARHRDLTPTSVTSRESADVRRVAVTTVSGVTLGEHAPWLQELYHGEFRELAERACGIKTWPAADSRIGVNLNIQRGVRQRYEAHVDSNPVEGLLYVTTHSPGEGGELVVANRSNAVGIAQIDQDSATIYPVAGHLLFFDAREHPHYVRALTSPGAVRVVAAMNYYTEASTEGDRPADLNRHLFGVD